MFVRVGDAALEQLANRAAPRRGPARDAEGEARRVALQRLDVVRRDLVERDRVDEHEPLDALRAVVREVHRHRAAEIDADDRRLGQPERGERAVEIVRLRGDAELGVEGAIGLAVAEQIDRERGAIRQRELGADVAPEEAARAESVHEQDRRTAVTVSLHVHGARADGDAQQISVHGNVVLERLGSRSGDDARVVAWCAIIRLDRQMACAFADATVVVYHSRRRVASFAQAELSSGGCMSEQEQTYDDGRARNLEEILRALAERIRELDRRDGC